MNINKKLLAITAISFLLAGCATAPTPKEAELKKAAGFSRATDMNNLTISNIDNDGNGKTSFIVNKSGGGKWNCYVTSGATNYLGAIMPTSYFVSDAICSGTDGEGKAVKTCDALSKAAGKC
jgi:hypothetical protein